MKTTDGLAVVACRVLVRAEANVPFEDGRVVSRP